MYERTLTVFSAGKTFSMTGLRLGWVIANEKIIKVLSKVNINISFCIYEPT
jgi:aspartate/methionine/tyrosine aminotransferase